MAYQDNITDVWDIPGIEKQQAKVISLVQGFVKEVHSSAKELQSIEFGLGGKNSLKGLQDATKQVEALSKQQIDSMLAMAKAAKLEAEARLLNAKAATEEAKQKAILTKENIALAKESERLQKAQDKETQSATKAKNAYEILKQVYKINADEAKRLGAQYGLNSVQFKEATDRAQKYHKQLMALETSVGQHQRNVGNYANAQMALNQVLREAPAFANSFQTGLMGISNNLPMLTDQLKALRAQGLGTKDIIKVMAGSLLEFGSVISIAVTAGMFLLQYFKSQSEEADKAKEANHEYLDSLHKIAEEYAKEKSKLDELYRTATNVTLSYRERGKAVDELQKQFPEYFGSLDREKILNGEVTDTYDALTAAIMRRAQAQGRAAAIAETAMQLAKAEAELESTRSKDPNRFVLYTDQETEALKLKISWLKQQLNTQTQLDQQIKETETLSFGYLDEETRKQKEASDALQKKLALMTEEERKEYLKKHKTKEKETFSVGLGDEETDLDNPLSKNAALAKSLQILFEKYGEINYRQTGLFAHHEQLSDEAAKKLNTELEMAHEARERDYKDEKEYAEKKKKLAEEVAKLKRKFEEAAIDAVRAWRNRDFQQQLNEVDERIAKGEEESQKEISNIKNSTLSNEEKQQQIAAIEASATATKQIETEKRKKIQYDAAVADRKIVLAQMIAETGLAAIRALGAKPYTPANIQQAYVIAGIGAAQVATVLAQPITAYAEGTPEGGHPVTGPALAGEAGAEVVIEPGKAPYVVSKPTYYANMAKGTEVIPVEQIQAMAGQIGAGYGVPVLSQQYGDNAALLNAVQGLRSDLQNQTQHQTIWDEKGIRHVVIKGNTRIEYLSKNVFD